MESKTTPAPSNFQKADELFNYYTFNTFTNTVSGLGAGTLASIFFKRKLPVIFFAGGVAAGLSARDYLKAVDDYRR